MNSETVWTYCSVWIKKALTNVRHTSPGKDSKCYTVLEYMDNDWVVAVLWLFKAAWETGIISSTWKQSAIVPILKPRKDLSDPSNYRPINVSVR